MCIRDRLTVGRLMNKVWPAFTMPNDLELAAISRDPAVVEAYQQDPLVHHLSLIHISEPTRPY